METPPTQDDPHARIQRRAYELWEAEGRPSGRDREHWLRAEAEIRGLLPTPLKPRPPAALPRRERPKRPAAPSPGSRRG
jgi:hypothetical protein